MTSSVEAHLHDGSDVELQSIQGRRQGRKNVHQGVGLTVHGLRAAKAADATVLGRDGTWNRWKVKFIFIRTKLLLCVKRHLSDNKPIQENRVEFYFILSVFAVELNLPSISPAAILTTNKISREIKCSTFNHIFNHNKNPLFLSTLLYFLKHFRYDKYFLFTWVYHSYTCSSLTYVIIFTLLLYNTLKNSRMSGKYSH